MNGLKRREEILNIIMTSNEPVSGAELAKQLTVSRQVIVQDIAILRASNNDIVSTNRGYILISSKTVQRIFKVNHTDEQIEEELNTIVDLGGTVVDVFVNHKVYGKIRADFYIRNRRNVQEFMDGINSGKSRPLKNVTSDYHYHTVEADSEQTLDLIEKALKEKRFLIEK